MFDDRKDSPAASLDAQKYRKMNLLKDKFDTFWENLLMDYTKRMVLPELRGQY